MSRLTILHLLSPWTSFNPGLLKSFNLRKAIGNLVTSGNTDVSI